MYYQVDFSKNKSLFIKCFGGSPLMQKEHPYRSVNRKEDSCSFKSGIEDLKIENQVGNEVELLSPL